MIVSTRALNLIKDSESLSLVPYTCPAGHATIGWGHLMHRGPVTEEDRKIVWTVEEAEAALAKDVVCYAKAVEKAVRVPLNQNQFDALVDWTFNLGAGRLNEKECSWLRELNKGNYSAVPELLKRWNKGKVNGILVELSGLTDRRKKEAKLFAKPYPESV